MADQRPFDRFDCLSDLDYRYHDPEVTEILSERAFVRYKAKVEAGWVVTLAQYGVCSPEVADDVRQAAEQIDVTAVYEEERVVRHDIRALVHCIQRGLALETARPYVHLAATSYDIVDTANALRYRDVTFKVLHPALKALISVLLDLAEREADTVQIGRTHGQHAVPLTFGYMIAGYISRLGISLMSLEHAASNLYGKCSGAVGAYNALALLVPDPREFERSFVEEFELHQPRHSTQIVPPENLMRLMNEVVIIAGILADLADDIRHLQRSEIGEVGEQFEAGQVGSSTMPQKKNPISFENVKSMWKSVLGRVVTYLLDQLSEHQRDLTNSQSSRTYPQLFAYVIAMTKRLTRAMAKLEVDHARMAANLKNDSSLSESLYIILASLGHPDAHEAIRELNLAAVNQDLSIVDLAKSDPALAAYFDRMTPAQLELLSDPTRYTGIAAQETRAICSWYRGYLFDIFVPEAP